MNPPEARQSTTATPLIRWFTTSTCSPVGRLASTSVVTVPAAGLLLRHVNPELGIILGLLPALPYLLITLAFAACYLAAIAMILITTLIPALCRDDDHAQRLDDLIIRVTNAWIAAMTLTPLVLPARKTKRAAQRPVRVSSSPTPLASSRTPSKFDEPPFFWSVLQEMGLARQKQGATPIVTPEELFGPVRGRHARPASSEPPASATTSSSPSSSAPTQDGDHEPAMAA